MPLADAGDKSRATELLFQQAALAEKVCGVTGEAERNAERLRRIHSHGCGRMGHVDVDVCGHKGSRFQPPGESQRREPLEDNLRAVFPFQIRGEKRVDFGSRHDRRRAQRMARTERERIAQKPSNPGPVNRHCPGRHPVQRLFTELLLRRVKRSHADVEPARLEAEDFLVNKCLRAFGQDRTEIQDSHSAFFAGRIFAGIPTAVAPGGTS